MSALSSIEGRVEFEHIDPRLTQEAELALAGMIVDKRTHIIGIHVPGTGDPIDLDVGVGHTDVGIQAGAGGRQGVGGNLGLGDPCLLYTSPSPRD